MGGGWGDTSNRSSVCPCVCCVCGVQQLEDSRMATAKRKRKMHEADVRHSTPPHTHTHTHARVCVRASCR